MFVKQFFSTGNGTLVVMTKDFDPLCEYPIHTNDFGEGENITYFFISVRFFCDFGGH